MIVAKNVNCILAKFAQAFLVLLFRNLGNIYPCKISIKLNIDLKNGQFQMQILLVHLRAVYDQIFGK